VDVGMIPRFRNSLMNKVSGLLSPTWCQTTTLKLHRINQMRNTAEVRSMPEECPHLTITSKSLATKMSNYPKKGTHPSKFLNVPGCAAINYPTD
jgi:hypothetical protein